jgi:hypothetical protein
MVGRNFAVAVATVEENLQDLLVYRGELWSWHVVLSYVERHSFDMADFLIKVGSSRNLDSAYRLVSIATSVSIRRKN